MSNIAQILAELNVENGSNYKLDTLKKYKDDALLKRVFKLALDSISFTYGVSAQRWLGNKVIMEEISSPRDAVCSIEDFLDLLEFKLSTRRLTGNAAISAIDELLFQMSPEDAQVALLVLGRDLKVNVGRTNAMKVWKDLIDKPAYMRCGVFNSKSKKEISYPAILQLKADGTYRQAHVSVDGEVSFMSRAGKSYEYPLLEEVMKNFPAGYYMGELTVVENGKTLSRAEGNGLINSDNPPHEHVVFDTWDFVIEEEYSNAKRKVKNKTAYSDRFSTLKSIVNTHCAENIRTIESYDVASSTEAAEIVSKWMSDGFEGGVLKDKTGVFQDGTSKVQLKMKLEMEIDVRIVGYKEGTPGTKREDTFGALFFSTDDEKIKGKTSGFTDADLQMFNENREQWIGKIISVKCNDITKATGNDHYALSHPRFAELRLDKTETDTFERAMEIREMSFEFSDR